MTALTQEIRQVIGAPLGHVAPEPLDGLKWQGGAAGKGLVPPVIARHHGQANAGAACKFGQALDAIRPVLCPAKQP